MNSNLKKNLIYQTMYQILAILLPLIISPYVSRVLGAENLGDYTYSFSIAEYFVLFAMLGINNYGNRVIAVNRDNKDLLYKSFSSIFILHLFVAIIFTIIYYFYTFFFSNNVMLFFIQGLYVISSIVDVNWFFFGIENFKLSVVRNTLIKISTVLLIFIFVTDKQDIYIYAFIMALCSLSGNVIMFVCLPRYTKLVKVGVNDIIKHIKPLLILFVPVIAISLYKIMDRIMIGALVPKSQLGYYSNSEKAINIPISIIGAFGTVMLPRMSNMLKRGINSESKKFVNNSVTCVMMLAVPLTFGLGAVSNCFATVFWGEEFSDCGKIINCLSLSIPFLAFANVIRTQLLIPLSKDGEYIVSVFLGALVNVVVNFILIPKYYAMGAAIGTVLAEAMVCITQTAYIRKEINVIKILKNSMIYLLFGIAMYVFLLLLTSKMDYNIFSLIIQILVGASIYIVLCFVYLWRTKSPYLVMLSSTVKKCVFNHYQ